MKRNMDIESLFNDLLTTVTGKVMPMVSVPPTTPPAAPAGQRCAMCGTPGANHTGQSQCVGVMRKTLATLLDDDGYLPAPAVPPIPIGAGQREAYRRYAESQARNVGKVTPRR